MGLTQQTKARSRGEDCMNPYKETTTHFYTNVGHLTILFHNLTAKKKNTSPQRLQHKILNTHTHIYTHTEEKEEEKKGYLISVNTNTQRRGSRNILKESKNDEHPTSIMQKESTFFG